MLKRITVLLIVLAVFTANITVTFAAVEQKDFVGWTAFINTPAAVTPNSADYNINPDRNVKNSGEAAMRFVFNSGMRANLFVQLRQYVDLEANKTYRYSFWAKASNASDFNVLIDWANPKAASDGGTHDWKKYTFDYTNGSAAKRVEFMFILEGREQSGAPAEIWLDDMTFHELDGSEITGENMLANPGFEEGLDSTPPGNARNITATQGDSTLDLAWTDPSDADLACIEIYDAAGGASPIATVNKGVQAYRLTGLVNGTTYTYRLVSADDSGNKSAGATVSGIPNKKPDKPNVTADIVNKVIVGIDTSMEYQIDNGAWIRYNASNSPNLSGRHLVTVRKAAGASAPAGYETVLIFVDPAPVVPKNKIVISSIDYTGNKITVAGQHPDGADKAVTIKVTKKGAGIRDYESIFFLYQMNSGTNGRYTASYTMPDVKNGADTTGTYTAVVEGSGVLQSDSYDFDFVNTPGRAAAFAELSTANSEAEIKNLFAESSQYHTALVSIGIDLNGYSALGVNGKDTVARRIKNSLPFEDEIAAKTICNSIIALERIHSSGKADIKGILDSYSGMLELSAKGVLYEDMAGSADAQYINWMLDRVCEGSYTSIENLRTFYQVYDALYTVNNASYGDIEETIQTAANLFEIENYAGYSSYRNLSGTVKVDASKALVMAASQNPFKTVDELKAALTAVIPGTNQLTSSGGGGGGAYTPGRVSSVVEAVGSLNTGTVNSGAMAFTDLGNVSWAIESIQALFELNIINGVDDTHFSPDSSITRAQYIKMLMGAFNIVDLSAECTFTDVSPGDWHYHVLASAQKLGIAAGLDDGSFGCDNAVTREEMAVLGFRTLSVVGITLPQVNEAASFTDNGLVNQWAVESVEAMQKAGVLNGFEDGSFQPQGAATRAQGAKVVHYLMSAAKGGY